MGGQKNLPTEEQDKLEEDRHARLVALAEKSYLVTRDGNWPEFSKLRRQAVLKKNMDEQDAILEGFRDAIDADIEYGSILYLPFLADCKTKTAIPGQIDVFKPEYIALMTKDCIDFKRPDFDTMKPLRRMASLISKDAAQLGGMKTGIADSITDSIATGNTARLRIALEFAQTRSWLDDVFSPQQLADALPAATGAPKKGATWLHRIFGDKPDYISAFRPEDIEAITTDIVSKWGDESEGRYDRLRLAVKDNPAQREGLLNGLSKGAEILCRKQDFDTLGRIQAAVAWRKAERQAVEEAAPYQSTPNLTLHLAALFNADPKLKAKHSESGAGVLSPVFHRAHDRVAVPEDCVAQLQAVPAQPTCIQQAIATLSAGGPK